MAVDKVRRQVVPAGRKPRPGSSNSPAEHQGAALSSRTLLQAGSDPRSLSHRQVLRLQRAVGNRLTQRLLAWDVQRQPVGPEGGAVGSEAQSQIESARGRGRPLDPVAGGRIGQSLGADFSQVRVHTDRTADLLNRSLNAKAFTVGSDIFFSRGKYSPGSPGGQRLLAHELTHVVQQSGAGANKAQAKLDVGPAGDRFEQEADRVAAGITASPASIAPAAQRQATPVVQRAVGYEFETNYKVERKNTGIKSWFNAYRPLKKMEVITPYTEGFRMEADENSTLGSTIEFVVDPPVQETQEDKLDTILTKFGQVAGQLDAGKNAPDTPVMLDTLTGDPTHNDIRVTPKAAGLIGNPQVTGGVSFDKLITLLSEIGGGAGPRGDVTNPHYEAKSELETMSPDAPARTAAKGISAGGSAEFQGMTAFLSSYLNFGKKQSATYPPLNYAKLISNSVLLRTDFGSMFKKLKDPERTPFETNPQSFATTVLAAAGMAGTENTKVFERGIRKSQNKKSKNYTKLVDMPITRGQWLKTITTGVDKLSIHHMPKLKSELEGLGALGPRTDRVGYDPAPTDPQAKDKGSGIIMEFRNMRKNVNYADFMTLAKGVFVYLKELNRRGQDDEDQDF